MLSDEATTSRVDTKKLEELSEPATKAYAHIIAEAAAARYAVHIPLWREVRRLSWGVLTLVGLFATGMLILLAKTLSR